MKPNFTRQRVWYAVEVPGIGPVCRIEDTDNTQAERERATDAMKSPHPEPRAWALVLYDPGSARPEIADPNRLMEHKRGVICEPGAACAKCHAEAKGVWSKRLAGLAKAAPQPTLFGGS